MNKQYQKKVKEAINYIKKEIKSKPKIAIIFGTSLSESFLNDTEIIKEIPYYSIPHFKSTKIESHLGKMVFSKVGGKQIVSLCGRYHFYEGYNLQEIVFPIHVLKEMGIETLIITSAVGGINKNYKLGDLVVIEDHINLTGINPLIGYKDPFLDTTHIYNKEIIKKVLDVTSKNNFYIHKGIMFFLTGPTFETPAEAKAVERLGGDTIAWSTLPEAIVAHYFGIKILAINCITDITHPDIEIEEKNLQDIINVAQNKCSKSLLIILKDLIKDL